MEDYIAVRGNKLSLKAVTWLKLTSQLTEDSRNHPTAQRLGSLSIVTEVKTAVMLGQLRMEGPGGDRRGFWVLLTWMYLVSENL
jgi:hypothetical protein